MKSIAVIVPHYRQAEFLTACIESLLAQTRRPDEILIADSSPDETGEIIARFGDAVRHLPIPANGVAAARNAGLAATRCDLVAFLDSDNLMLPGTLARFEQAFAAHRDPVLCHGALVPIDRSGATYAGLERYNSEPVPFVQQLGWLIERNRIMTDTVCARRDVIEALGGFCETPGVREDYDLWLRMASLGQFVYIAAPLAQYRRHETNLSNGKESYEFIWEGGALRRLDWPTTVAALEARFTDENRRRLAEGEVRLRRGERDEAKEIFLELLGGSEVLGAMFHLSHMAIDAGDLDWAEELLEQATEDDPGNAGLWNNTGVLWALRHDRDLAHNSFALALAVRDHYEDPKRNLARLAAGEQNGWHLTRRRLRPELMPLAAIAS